MALAAAGTSSAPEHAVPLGGKLKVGVGWGGVGELMVGVVHDLSLGLAKTLEW